MDYFFSCFSFCTGNRCEEAAGPKSVKQLAPLVAPTGGISVATWNISGVNNNPFEYFMSHDDPNYGKLMAGVEKFIEAPGELDVTVGEIFSRSWFDELKGLMIAAEFEGVETVANLWKEDYSKRKIISGFLKDKSIGAKRLASMPDRLTNTIRLADDGASACRPTVINNYVGSLSTLDEWWSYWKIFMFKNVLRTEGKDGKAKAIQPYELLSKISSSKYPAVTADEEKVSVPLQMLCLAIFDAIMVHIMLTLSPDGSWQGIKRSIVEAIFNNKDAKTLAVLSNACAGADVICLQECAAAFKKKLCGQLGDLYHVAAPADVDPKRDQNSMVLLRKQAFPDGVQDELTQKACAQLSAGKKVAIESGDLCVFTAKHLSGCLFLVASFHGDTNGLASIPVVSAIGEVLKGLPSDCQPVVGLDANTYIEQREESQNVNDFLKHCETLGLRSYWSDGGEASDYITTCVARTYLQPQLNKAIKTDEMLSKGDVNPKDHILFSRNAFDVEQSIVDNTGVRSYKVQEFLPSLHFPSDHAIVMAVLQKKTAA